MCLLQRATHLYHHCLLDVCVLIDPVWCRNIAVTSGYWVLVSLSILSEVHTSLSPLLIVSNGERDVSTSERIDKDTIMQ
jgi:hypothetical protein